MSRHNRRKYRGSQKLANNTSRRNSLSLGCETPPFLQSGSFPFRPTTSSRGRRPLVSVASWQDRYTQWSPPTRDRQSREAPSQRQRQQPANLKPRQTDIERIFGGEDSAIEDEADAQLCFNMMAYFGGLDFID